MLSNCTSLKNCRLVKDLTISLTSPGFMFLQYKSFENTVRKGEIALNEQFLLFLL